jgi:K+-sensing histidine kinase KdpD
MVVSAASGALCPAHKDKPFWNAATRAAVARRLAVLLGVLVAVLSAFALALLLHWLGGAPAFAFDARDADLLFLVACAASGACFGLVPGIVAALASFGMLYHYFLPVVAAPSASCLEQMLDVEVAFFLPDPKDDSRLEAVLPAHMLLEGEDSAALEASWQQLQASGLGTGLYHDSSWPRAGTRCAAIRS